MTATSDLDNALHSLAPSQQLPTEPDLRFPRKSLAERDIFSHSAYLSREINLSWHNRLIAAGRRCGEN